MMCATVTTYTGRSKKLYYKDTLQLMPHDKRATMIALHKRPTKPDYKDRQ
jgi:hypothetical protein